MEFPPSHPPHPEIDTWVYFIQQGDEHGPIKIGWSSNPERRLRALQLASAGPLRLLRKIHGCSGREHVLHHRFRHLRLRGEWFRPAPDLYEYIRTAREFAS